MVRTVKVRLELDRNDYKAGLQAAAAETRAFDSGVKDLGDHAARTGVEMKAAGSEIQAAGDKATESTANIHKLGAGLEATGARGASALENIDVALHQVNQEIDRSKTLMSEFAQELGRTGDMSLVDRITGEKNNANRLQKFRTDLQGIRTELESLSKAGTGGNAQGGFLNFAIDEWVAKLATGTKRGIQSGVDQVSGMAPTGLVQWLVAGGAAAAPALLAAINGALLAGVGTIGIGAGIAAQARDPQIQAAYKSLGHDIMTDLTDATSSFKGPLIAVASDFGAAWHQILPGLKSDWDALAPSVERLGAGFAGLVTHTMPGFNDALAASVPIIDMLSTELPRLGDAFNSFFQSIAAGGEGGKKALQDLIFIIESSITWTGKMIEIGGKAFNWLDKLQLLGPLAILMDRASESTGRAQKTLAEYNAEGNKAHQALAGMAGEVALTTAQFQQQVSAIDRVLGATLGLDQANLGTAESLTRIGDAVRQNGHALDIHTAAGQANRQAVLGVVQANISQYDAMIRAGAGADEAAAAYDQNTGALERQLQQAGFTRDQIDQLIGKYRNVPANVDTDIAMHGLQTALEGLDDTIRRVNGLDGRVATVTVEEVHRTTYVNSTPPTQVFHGLASGGVRSYAFGGIDMVAASGVLTPSYPGTILAAEPQTGGEALIPRLGIPNDRGLSLANTAAGWHGGHVVRNGTAGGAAPVSINVTVHAGMGTDGRAVGRQIVQVLRDEVRSRGGGNVQAALGV